MGAIRVRHGPSASQLPPVILSKMIQTGNAISFGVPAAHAFWQARRFTELFARGDRAILNSREAREMFGKFMESRSRERYSDKSRRA